MTTRRTRKSKPADDPLPNQTPVAFNTSSYTNNTREPTTEDEKQAFEELDLDAETRKEAFEDAKMSEKTIVKQEAMDDDLDAQFTDEANDDDIMRDDTLTSSSPREEAASPKQEKAEDEEDELVMEYEVYLTHKLEQNLHMIQYPLRPKDRPYNFKSLKKMSMKPNHKIINMDFELNQHTPDFDRDSEFKKKNLHSLKSTPVPLKSNYCVGVLRGTSLFITPLLNISKMLPNMQYLTEHFDNDVRMVDDEPAAGEEGAAGAKKRGRKKAPVEATVVATLTSKREQREQEKSFSYLQKLEEQEEAIELNYHDKEHFASGAVFERLLTAPFGEITFNMTPDEYIDTLVPYKEDPLAQYNQKVVSLDLLRHMNSPKSQVLYMMKAAKILSYDRIRELATRITSEEQLLQILPPLAFFIRGRWVANADTASQPGYYERWTYMILQFYKHGEVKRADFAKATRISPEKAQEMLETISELVRTDEGNVWRLKGEEDHVFPVRYPEIIAEQQKQLDGLENDIARHVETGFTNISTKAKDSRALAAMAVTSDDLRKMAYRFVVSTAKQFGVINTEVIRARLKAAQASKDSSIWNKITVDHIKLAIRATLLKFNKSGYVVKKINGMTKEDDEMRNLLIETFTEKQTMTKEEILATVQEKLGKPIPTNLFFKFTEELCRKPSKGSKTFVAKDGSEPMATLKQAVASG